MIVGIDLAPIKPIPNAVTLQGDIRSDRTRAAIRGHLKTWQADIVLHDGAPNVGTAWVQDSYDQAELVLHSLKLATEFLIAGGTFVTKVFRSKDYNSLLWVFQQLFNKVEATKPPSSRNVSAEIFVVCRGFKAPKRIDPRLLDARSVFQELDDSATNAKAVPRVFNPEVKRRHREGYEEGNYTQYKEAPASEFVQSTDPIAILGTVNRLSFARLNGENEVLAAALYRLPDTTSEIRTCCADLKVLGRKEFKLLLTWRLKVRELLGFTQKKIAEEEVVEIEPMDKELSIQEELRDMETKETAKRKRAKRRENEKKQKEIVRMQMNMTAPTDLVQDENAPNGADTMFRLKTIDDSADVTRSMARGKMAALSNPAKAPRDSKESEDDPEEGEASLDTYDDRLDEELDTMYEHFKEKVAERDAKYRAKMARKQRDDEEWEGVSGSEQRNSESEDEELEEASGEESDEIEGQPPSKKLIRDLDVMPPETNGLSKRAHSFFDQEIFNGIYDLQENVPERMVNLKGKDKARNGKVEDQHQKSLSRSQSESSEEDIPSLSEQKRLIAASKVSAKEEDHLKVRVQSKELVGDEDVWDNREEHTRDNRPAPDIDIITVEAMTLAHQIATGQKSRHDLVDDGFNKYSHKDRDGLPDWFLEDEAKHEKAHKPITKAAAQAIQEKLRAYNARPIKKVREAKARKKFKMAQRVEKMKKKGALLVEDDALTEREKAGQIVKIIARAGKTKPRKPVTVVKASSRTGRGRPAGVKGRYKMVDPRMRKEVRAMKRLEKKKR